MSDHGEATTTSVKKKLCVIGDGCCKHFDLMWYISRDCPVGNCMPGCNLSFSATVEVDSTLVELSLEDCPGGEDFEQLRRLRYPDTDVFLLCFSVSSPESLENAELRYFPEVQRYCPTVPIILVATQIESRDDERDVKRLARTNEKHVTMEAGRAAADRLGISAYLECSDITGQGMSELRRTAALTALSHVPTTQTRRNCCGVL